MRDFCTEHGEGKKWYLQAKNYSDELLFQELSAIQKEIVGAETRAELRMRIYGNRFSKMFGTYSDQNKQKDSSPPDQSPDARLSEKELLERQQVQSFGQVLPIEEVEKVIDLAESITRMPCGCRFKTTGKADKRYCFGFVIDKLGTAEKFPDSASSFESLDRKEAIRILREYDEQGQLHTVWARVPPHIGGLCNCDHDCLAYRGFIEKGGVPRFFRAEYICQIDWDLCTGCRECMKQCQFGAQFYSNGMAKVHIDPTRCFGCGVCRAVCPHDAISMIPRQEVPEAADIWLKNEKRGE